MAGAVTQDGINSSASDVSAPTQRSTPAVVPAGRYSRAERARRTAYRGRFASLFIALAAFAGVAIGTTVVLVGRGSPAPAPPWSEWEPVGSPERRAGQIGEHVASGYHLPSGRELVEVTYSGPPTVTGPDGSTFQVRSIAIEPDTSGGRAEADDIHAINANGTVMYTLCGLGVRCSIPGVATSSASGALLRREALEISLYTFKYVDGVDSVLTLLPPRPDGQAATAVFLERQDVSAELSRPLNETFTAPIAPDIGQIGADELRSINRVTRPRVYTYGYLQAQDGSPIMVLTPALST